MSRIIIIGGGAIGLSLALHLAMRGERDVVLLERHQLTSGTTWHAAGIVGPLRATPNMTRLAMQALTTIPALEASTGQMTGYRRTGGFWLARHVERLDELHRIGALGRHLGLDARMRAAPEVAALAPYLALEEHAGALEVPEDAQVNPVDLCMAYARAARQAGVTIREGVSVTGIVSDDGQVRGVNTSDGEFLPADRVALCAGAWSGPLAADAGVALPLQAVEHMYVVTAPVPGIPDPFPVIRDLDTGIYIKGDVGGKLVIGGFEPDAKCWDARGPQGDVAFLELPDDWEQFTPFMEAALRLLPALEHVGITRFMNGPESFTHDTRPLVGEAPDVDGLFVAAGMNSVGVMSSAGIGKALADWMSDGEAPMDLLEIDLARADPETATPAHMASRMREAVADLFAMHWPHKQPVAGRDLRRSVLHDRWASEGAVFGLTGGWERGLWYARCDSERDLPYSVGAQPWQAIAEREAAALHDGCVALDLSPFGKFQVCGPDALAFMQHLVTADVDVDSGRCVYAQVLNERGGIEADVTVTRDAADGFRITSAAAMRWRDASVLRRRAASFDVRIEDVTEAEAVIGVMGGGAFEVLAAVSAEAWPDLAFSTCQAVVIDGVECRATRLSFVGDRGFEIGVPVAGAGQVFDALRAAGASPMGHYALESCRIEKGYRAFGHDLGPDVTPLEAGLGFTVCWNKDFVGRAALEAQRLAGLRRRLCLFRVEGAPLMLHDEPVIEDHRVVGLTTSGTTGVRTGLTLAFGLVDIEPGEALASTCERVFDIDVAGQRHPARVQREPPFDPRGERLRG